MMLVSGGLTLKIRADNFQKSLKGSMFFLKSERSYRLIIFFKIKRINKEAKIKFRGGQTPLLPPCKIATDAGQGSNRNFALAAVTVFGVLYLFSCISNPYISMDIFIKGFRCYI